jgi:hypothetical protein
MIAPFKDPCGDKYHRHFGSQKRADFMPFVVLGRHLGEGNQTRRTKAARATRPVIFKDATCDARVASNGVAY